MKRLWPKSLVGQLMLLVALALFVAQAINFAFLVQAGERLRFAEAAGPMVGRIADVSDRMSGTSVERPGRRGGRGRRSRRRIDIDTESAVSREGLPRIHRREAAFMDALRDVDVAVRTVELGVSENPPPRRFQRRNLRNPEREARSDWLRISVELESGEWLNSWLRVRPRSIGSVGIMLAQTLILFLILLGAIWWFAKKLSRPLRTLTAATSSFDPAAPAKALPVSGPRDLSSLIEAHNAMRERIAAMLHEKDHMLGAIGHDLRTPLAALRIRPENVEDRSERARMVETIEDMSATLEDILSLARLGRPGVERERLDLAALVDSAIEDFRDVGAVVSFDETARVVVTGRPSLLKRAIRNLIDNAVRYGGSASVAVIQSNGKAIVTVNDDGPGIPEDKIEDVLEPFARLDESRSRDGGGAGLGLALARAIAADHDGELVLYNRENGGLRATIALPLDG